MSTLIPLIDAELRAVKDALAWTEKYGKTNFSAPQFKEYRRKARRIREALGGRCSVAAYGESQVGKSYLMSSLLSTPSSPFVISAGDREYSFINDINPSGGNLQMVESTGIITRFTTTAPDEATKNLVKVQCLTVADVVMLVLDSYYNDLRLNSSSTFAEQDINSILNDMAASWASSTVTQQYIDEDDIADIRDYVNEVVGNSAASLCRSDFFEIVGKNIARIPMERWTEVFGLLWNRNEHMSHLFTDLINHYSQLGFESEVYVPFDAVLRDGGTLLKIQWLDLVCGYGPDGEPAVANEELSVTETPVYDRTGRQIASAMSKAYLSALAAEVTFHVPAAIASEREFLKYIDLLDFPGARSRERCPESELAQPGVLPTILRRGKVAYLFNKYSRQQRLSAILYCHHGNQRTEATIGESINAWIEKTIGRTPEDRALTIKATDGVSPLMMIATKFNIDLAYTSNDRPGALANHWSRFNDVIPELIKPYKWLEQWTTPDGMNPTGAFRSVYPLRDFYWSGCSKAGMSFLFEGYSDTTAETGYRVPEAFPGYFDELRDSFVTHEFVTRHFASPADTWLDVATPGNDGTGAIIRDLNRLAPRLDSARMADFTRRIKDIVKRTLATLDTFYQPEDSAEKVDKRRKVASAVLMRFTLTVGRNPERFGRIIDSLMIAPNALRRVARDVLEFHIEQPVEMTQVNLLLATAGIEPADSREVMVTKLCEAFMISPVDEDALREMLEQNGENLDEVLSDTEDICTTESDVVAKHIMRCWGEHIAAALQEVESYVALPDEIESMVKNLAVQAGLRARISRQVDNLYRPQNVAESCTAIADYAALELNNFVSTLGLNYVTPEMLPQLQRDSDATGIRVDLSDEALAPARSAQSLEETLSALDASTTILAEGRFTPDNIRILRQLPLWDNYYRWRNLLMLGFVRAGGHVSGDPQANKEIKEIIDHLKEADK